MNGGPRWASQPPLPGQQATVRRKAAAPSCHSLLLLLLLFLPLLLHIYLPTLSLHFIKPFLLFRELYCPGTLYPVRFSDVTWEDDGGGLGVLGRGGVGAWLGGGAERASEVALAAAPPLAKLGLPSPGPAASHSASQHGWRAEQTRPVRAA